MRIIAGEAGGRRLSGIKTDKVRPTLDRVKEAIFNIINYKVCGSKVLDLFSGFGNLGLEAVSRGAEYADFVEKNRRHARIIHKNIGICKFDDRTNVYSIDVFVFLQKYSKKYDLIFMDPPYSKNYINKVMEILEEKDIMANGGLIIAEHHKNDNINDFKQFIAIRDRNYGDTFVKVYKKREAEKNYEKSSSISR